MDPITTYCDDYEAITGKAIPTVETKVITAPEPIAVAPTTTAEVAAPAAAPVDVAVEPAVAAPVPAPVETPGV